MCKLKNKNLTELFNTLPNLSSLNFKNSNSNEKLTVDKNNQIIFMYADWCGHCQQFKPEWEAFEGWCKNNGVTCNAINGGDESNSQLVQKYGIEGFPTVLKCDKNGNKVSEYLGDRNKDGLIEFASI